MEMKPTSTATVVIAARKVAVDMGVSSSRSSRFLFGIPGFADIARGLLPQLMHAMGETA